MSGQHCLLAERDIGAQIFTSANSLAYFHDNHLLTVPEIIDPVFTKTSQNVRFLLSENERFRLVLVKTGSTNSGTGLYKLQMETEIR